MDGHGMYYQDFVVIYFMFSFILQLQSGKLIESNPSVTFFTITAEIHARSLVNFYCQYADRHMNLKFMRRVSERERAIRQFVIVKKQIDVSF